MDKIFTALIETDDAMSFQEMSILRPIQTTESSQYSPLLPNSNFNVILP
jgi:hypothetical protein